MNTIQTLVAEEMYYNFVLINAKQCKPIHEEATPTYLLLEQK